VVLPPSKGDTEHLMIAQTAIPPVVQTHMIARIQPIQSLVQTAGPVLCNKVHLFIHQKIRTNEKNDQDPCREDGQAAGTE
jgi:hypothetical protein